MTAKTEAATPRTDAYYETYDAWMAFAKKNPNMSPELAEQCPIECSPDEFARQLERELGEQRAECERVKLALHWKEHELAGIEADLTTAGYAPQTLKHSNPDGTPREDKLTTGAVVMFTIEDLKDRAESAEQTAATNARQRDEHIADKTRILNEYEALVTQLRAELKAAYACIRDANNSVDRLSWRLRNSPVIHAAIEAAERGAG